MKESSESDSSDLKKSSEPLITNESHNPLLEASLEKVLDAEEQPNYLTPGSKLYDRKGPPFIRFEKTRTVSSFKFQDF